jgi:hypothetical protein
VSQPTVNRDLADSDESPEPENPSPEPESDSDESPDTEHQIRYAATQYARHGRTKSVVPQRNPGASGLSGQTG